MAILVDGSSRVLVQGITGREGAFHTERMLAAGTEIVGGVAPGKGGQTVCGLPVFDTISAAAAHTGANVTVCFVPARFAKGAALDAADAGIRLTVLITDGIPFRDMIELRAELARIGVDEIERLGVTGSEKRRPLLRSAVKLLGPNCPGVVSPGGSNVGVMDADIFMPGRVGIVSRSGTLTYEIVSSLTAVGIGQSTCVGIGGDPIHGIGFVECLELFEHDEQTLAVVLIGEIGGDDEERAAEFAAAHMTKPVVGYIAGITAPPGKRMGHAGAIVTGSKGTATGKFAAMRAAGVNIVDSPAKMGWAMAACLGAR